MQDQEIWKDVPGWEDCYSVSSLGNVFSKNKNKPRKTSISRSGYPFFTAKKAGKTTQLFHVHRLVAELFLDPPEDWLIEKCSKEHYGKVLVNHIDFDKTNNRSSNLEWCDNATNLHHARINNRIVNDICRPGVLHHRAKVTDVSILRSIREEYDSPDKRGLVKRLSEKYGLSRQIIRRIGTRKSYVEE